MGSHKILIKIAGRIFNPDIAHPAVKVAYIIYSKDNPFGRIE
jgi:hypothetical protein